MFVGCGEGELLPPGCEIPDLMMGVIPLTERRAATAEAEDEPVEIWACQWGEALSTEAQGHSSPWLTSSLTLPMEPTEG